MMLEQNRLELCFKIPKSWIPIDQAFFGEPRFKRVPRKLKKKANKLSHDFLTLAQKLWHLQDITNPNYNRFLINKILEKYNDRNL